MPKIIKNLDDKIFKAAMELFGNYGYYQADMKKIAKKVGIAVGTLYNYYPNKQSLFLAVFQKSWLGTLKSLDEVVEGNLDSRQKLLELIQVLNDEMRMRKGLGRELMVANSTEMGEDIWRRVHVSLCERFEKVIIMLENEKRINLDDATKKRLVEMILMTNFCLQVQIAHEDKENMAFMDWLLEKII